MEINAKTSFYFLLGNPVDHSFSPAIHNAGFQALASNSVYLAALVKPENIKEAIVSLKALNASGANVTSPHKEAVIPYLNSLTDEAAAICSVNTIVNREGDLFGASTDGEGFYQALKHTNSGFDLGEAALIIGAGGSARAIAYSLACHGLNKLFIANRTTEKAEKLTKMLTSQTILNSCYPLKFTTTDLKAALPQCNLVIYTLPLDSNETRSALIENKNLKSDLLFFDLRYSPAESEMIRIARRAGIKSYNGLGMLFRQAILSFELFTGREAPVTAMEEALKQAVKRMSKDGCY
jgi:shikimate dehydrogenase